MTTSVPEPFPRFVDLGGQPLEGGYVYVGTANTDPVTNKIAIFFDAACTVAADNPLRTSGGFIVNGSGTPQNVYAAGSTDFSMAVHNSVNAFLYSVASYPVRLLSSAITFGAITVQTSIEPASAGGATDGTLLKPWASTVTRDLKAKVIANYNETQPAAAADLVKLNQRAAPLLVGKQDTNSGAATTTNIYNCGTIRWIATGVYEVPFTVSPNTANVVCMVTPKSTTAVYANASIDVSLAFVDVTLFSAAGAAADAQFEILVVGYPDIADPIS